MLNGVYNAEGEPLGLETIYPPDPADAYDDYERYFDDGPDGPFEGCCERGDGYGKTVGETDENGYQFSALSIYICDYCGENVSGWYYENQWGPFCWDGWGGDQMLPKGYRHWEMPYPKVPRC